MMYRVRFHPLVARDLETIARWIVRYAGSDAADRRLAAIEREIASLAQTPHKGSIRDDITPGLWAIPAGRRAVIAFTVDDAAKEVLVHTVAYGGGDWVSRSRGRIV